MKSLLYAAAASVLLLAMGCESTPSWFNDSLAMDNPPAPVSQPAPDPAISANSASELGLMKLLVNRLGIDSQQALGGAGAIFALAQQRMNPSDFIRLAGGIPGMNRYLAAVPQSGKSNTWNSTAADLTVAESNRLGNLAVLAGSFQTLGLNTEMISRFMPVVLRYVQDQSGEASMSLLQNALY